MLLKVIISAYILVGGSFFEVLASPKVDHKIKVMTFNVENLFDTKHDEGKEDWDYLPASIKQSKSHKKHCSKKKGRRKQSCLKLDWNHKVLEFKMAQLASVILSVNDGKGPDLLIMPEIENEAVLKTFQKKFLAKAAYTSSVLIEGPDRRGIDVAMLSRLPLLSKPRIHPVAFKKAKLKYEGSTRPILEAKFKLPNGETLTSFGVHFPSPGHPHGTRVEAFQILKNLMDEASKNSELVLAAGDFNVKAGEDSRVYRQMAAPDLLVSHLVGCDLCLGTNYFKPADSWSFLDAIVVHKKSPWVINSNSVKIISNKLNTNTKGRPKRFNYHKKSGVSDHLPIMMTLERK